MPAAFSMLLKLRYKLDSNPTLSVKLFNIKKLPRVLRFIMTHSQGRVSSLERVTCSFARPKCVPLKLELTDWESVFRSTEEFCRPKSVRPPLERRKKSHTYVAPFAAHGLQLRCSVPRARGSGRQRDTPRQATRGSVHRVAQWHRCLH